MGRLRITDSLEREWLVGPALGYGTWGWSRLLTDGQGREAVLKVPYAGTERARGNVPPELVAACRLAAESYAVELETPSATCPALEATVELDDLQMGLVFPRYDTLMRRLAAGWPLWEVLDLVARLARDLADEARVHGNIRPGNVLFDRRGQVVLPDAVIAPLVPHHARLLDLAGAAGWIPPEHRRPGPGTRPGPPPTAASDAWSLCQLLFAAIWCASPADPSTEALAVATDGLDRTALAAVKHAMDERLEGEALSARFRTRVTERLGALLLRGLSAEARPSPPYRFEGLRELAGRAEEVLERLRPQVREVGRLLLPGTAQDGVFDTEDVTFGVAVTCSKGITDPEDLVCDVELAAPHLPPLRLEDLRPPAQLQQAGRLRYQVTVPQVRSGRHRIRVAFSVRGADDPPIEATGTVFVRVGTDDLDDAVERTDPAWFAGEEAPETTGTVAWPDDRHRPQARPPRIPSFPPDFSIGPGLLDDSLPVSSSGGDTAPPRPPMPGPQGRWATIASQPAFFLGIVVTGCLALVEFVTVLLKTFG